MSVTVAYDATHQNIAHLPAGQACGYTTGTPDIQWTTQDWAAHPRAVRICQDANASDATADILDVERGAATNTESPGWVKRAIVNFKLVTRRGQRWPGIYTSASNVTPLVNALIAGGITSGIGLWVANWNLSEAQAVADVLAASGPFPIIGIQFTDKPVLYDISVFSSTWLMEGSAMPIHPITAPPGVYLDGVFTGRGTNGELYVVSWDGATGTWTKMAWPLA